jgi:HD superfamily phosphohydrolase
MHYTLRIRDLVHGTIKFTPLEAKVINHPLFQRLRRVRQNDVAFMVYPSLNTSRFEHILGVCHIAGMMAERMAEGPQTVWLDYAASMRKMYGSDTKEFYVECCRILALIHDIGHFPFSHLFEEALKEQAQSVDKLMPVFLKDWLGTKNLKAAHEAFGSVLTRKVLADVGADAHLRAAVTQLMSRDDIPGIDPLVIVKEVISSAMGADRADAYKRDGYAAGGEYGQYEVARVCDTPCIFKKDDRWEVRYNERNLNTMEALFFERYRTYAWIHFHHATVMFKTLMQRLIVEAFKQEIIKLDDFVSDDIYKLARLDDAWLTGKLRDELDVSQDEHLGMIQRAFFLREKQNIAVLWKRRTDYIERWTDVKGEAGHDAEKLPNPQRMHERMRAQHGVSVLRFEAFESRREKTYIYLCRDDKLVNQRLDQVSFLLRELDKFWEQEPREFFVFVGKDAYFRREELMRAWQQEAIAQLRRE